MKPSATPLISQSSPEGFFWDSRLTLGRKQEIAKWIGDLKPQQIGSSSVTSSRTPRNPPHSMFVVNTKVAVDFL